MRDPIEELESFTTPGLSADPLPASEVRRRGARLQRRNRVLAGVAGAAAVAVVAVPFAVASAHHGSSAPQPMPAPAHTWTQTIPAGFPLTDGMPDGSRVMRADVQDALQPCGTQAWSFDGPVRTTDHASAWYTQDSEGGRTRGLAVYPTGDDASRAMRLIRRDVGACPSQDVQGPSNQTFTWEPAASDLGDDSAVWVSRYSDPSGLTGEMDVVQVVQVGNALLVDHAHGTGAGDSAVVDQLVGQLADATSPILADLCVFSDPAC